MGIGAQDQIWERLGSAGCLLEVGLSQLTGENGVAAWEVPIGRPHS